MINLSLAENQILTVSSFEDLVSAPFKGIINAICWTRELKGDFSEIVAKFTLDENIRELDLEDLLDLHLSEQGELAREVLLNDLKLLEAYGASPVLNLIRSYERDDTNPLLPTDVYSFHADRSPIATNTFLCTYYGDASEILPNSQAEKKILVPEILNELKKEFHGSDEDFGTYLCENSFDLHYRARPGAHPVNLGIGHLWRLAVDHPGSPVPPCIHRAPEEKTGKTRLLMIC